MDDSSEALLMAWPAKQVVMIPGMGALAVVLASLALLPAYDSRAWFGAGVLAVSLVVLVGFGLRALGTPRALVPVAQLAALVWAFLLTAAGDRMRLGLLPSGEALEVLGERLNAGLLVIARYAAPLPANDDLVVVTAFGVGLTAVAVDALAATFRKVPWAGLPLLMFYSVPAAAIGRGVSAFTFIPAAAGYLLLLISEGRLRLVQWGRVIGFADPGAGPSQSAETSTLGRTGRRVGALVIGLAVIVPAFLPALPAGPLAQGSGGGLGSGGRTIRVGNPLVDLKRDLTRPQDVLIGTYQTKVRSPEYMRLVVLDQFDGQTWRQSRNKVADLDENDGRLPSPPGLGSTVRRDTVRYSFRLSENLRSDWLLLPYPANSVQAEGDWRYDPDTLDVVAGEASASGLAYQVDSLAIDYQAADLATAGPAPADVRDRYTRLPPGVPAQVKAMADEVLREAKATNDYERAVALQDWFRSAFDYSLDRVSGQSGSALLDFLNDKSGYCEQFAATMAIMARQFGLPARVAVGYLPGENIGGDTWEVTARDAHAWPEIYFAGYGWVRFEPTPAVRTSLAPTWTLPDAEPSAPTSTVAPNQPDPSQRNPRQPPSQADPGSALPDAGTAEPAGTAGLAPALTGLGVVLLLLTPAVVRAGVRRRRLTRRRPADLAEGAWNELADLHRDLRLGWDETSTPRAACQAVSTRISAAPDQTASELRRLLTAVESSRYARVPANGVDVDKAVHAVAAALGGSVSWRRRLLARALPLSLWHQMFTRGRALGSAVERRTNQITDSVRCRLRRSMSRAGSR